MDKREAQQAFLGWLEERRMGRKRQEQERDEEYELLKASGLLETANPQPAMKKNKTTPQERGTASNWRGALGISPPGETQTGATTGTPPKGKGKTGKSKGKTGVTPETQPKGKGKNKGKDKGKTKLDAVMSTAPTAPVVQGPQWENLLNDTRLHCYMNIHKAAFDVQDSTPLGE